MFTGIVQGVGTVQERIERSNLVIFKINLPSEAGGSVAIGASVSVAGVCLTVVNYTDGVTTFDVMQETLMRTNLGTLAVGDSVNIERSAHVGDEIGGHSVSGHVTGVAEIIDIIRAENTHAVTFRCAKDLFRFIFHKGFIALDGASLTVVDPDPTSGTFTVWFIPETLRQTTFGSKKVGDTVNIECDPMTQVIVETVERVLESHKM